jgi:adenosine deaminase
VTDSTEIGSSHEEYLLPGEGILIDDLPKVSLHDHLDGGLRPETIVEIAAETGVALPAEDPEALERWFTTTADSGSLEDYLATFETTIAVMQTASSLERVAREFVLDLAADGVVHGEIRWAPEQHLRAGLTLDAAVEAVQEGLEQGVQEAAAHGSRLGVGQLITAMRHTDRSLEIAELALRHRERGAIGFDIAGAEAGTAPRSSSSPPRTSRRPSTRARRTASTASARRSWTGARCASATASGSRRTSASSARTTTPAT